MPRSFAEMLIICAVLAVIFIGWVVAAQAFEQSYPGPQFPSHPNHEWYLGRTDPTSGNSCCGGGDCAPVPLDADWVNPVEGGFQVTMSLMEARLVNENMKKGVDVLVPWERVMLLSAGKDAPVAIYHICLWGDSLKCLFVVPST